MPRTGKTAVKTSERRLGNVGLLILQAARQGSKENLEFVLELAEAKRSINYTDKYGQSPLMIAAKNGHLSCVKVLIANGANPRCKTYRQGQDQSICQIATRAGHLHVADYIQKCLDDLTVLPTTRAHLEKSVQKMASSPRSSTKELELFTVHLQQLIKHCNYDIDNSQNDDDGPPLLMRATKANNIKLVIKLIEEFQATPLINDPIKGENILHIACRNKSKLRYYLVNKYPPLLRNPDIKGSLPLHVACSVNDVEFISWLFKVILAEDDDKFEGEFPRRPMRRSGSLPDIRRNISHNPLIPSKVVLHPNRKPIVPIELSSQPLNLLNPAVSLPASTVRPLKRVFSQDYTDGDLIEDDEEEEEYDSDTPDGNGLILSYDSSRSNTISNSSRSSRSRSNSHSTLHNSSESNTCDRRGVSVSPEPQVSARELLLDEESEEEDRLLNMNILRSSSPLSVADIVDSKPFRVTVEGDSVLHILAKHGYYELLTIMMRVAEFIKRSVDLSVLTRRDVFSCHLPIEEAIQAKQVECVRLLIEFVKVAGLLPELLQDTFLLKQAVFTGDIDLVKILIEHGFHKGLSSAISLAEFSEYGAILRMLLYYQTQVVNALEFSRVRRNRRRTLDKGGIKWEGIQLSHVHPTWLYDCYEAVDSVSSAFEFTKVLSSVEENYLFFQKLGQDCLRYFSEKLTSPTRSLTHELTQITEINLSENQLSSVPQQLFQMPSLTVLILNHNQLENLPSSDNPYENIYLSPISRLEIDWNHLKTLPEDLFRGLSSTLQEVSAQNNGLEELPPGMWVIPKLKSVRLARNNLSSIHYFSNPHYFFDVELTRLVTSNFTNTNGSLVCNSKKKSAQLYEVEDYIHKLAKFYHTVYAAKGPFGFQQLHSGFDEVMNVHLARLVFFNQPISSELTKSHKCEAVTPSSQMLLPADDEEEDISCTLCDLELLDLSCNDFKEVPWDLPCIAPNLNKLDMSGNQLVDVDSVHSLPRNIHSVILDRNKLVNLEKPRPVSLPCGSPLRLLALPEDNYSDNYCRHCKHRCLDFLSNLSLNCNQLTHFPVVEVIGQDEEDHELNVEFNSLHCLPYFPALSILSLEHNHFTTVPEHMHHLTHLSSLSLSYNDIHELPPSVGQLNPQNLLLFKLEGMFIRNIPLSMLQKPTPKQMLGFLKALHQRSKPYRRIKLMVVGAGNKGKTSLLMNLTKRGKMNRFKDVEMSYNNLPLATVGVDLGDWEYSPNNKKPKITFMTWDFGGQEEYYATHQCFLTNRSLYLLIWNVEDGEKGLVSLKPWLENIESKAPRSPVIVIATHIDKIPPATRNQTVQQIKGQFQRLYISYCHKVFTYPDIQPVLFFVNCLDNKTMDHLRDFIYDFISKYKPPAPAHLLPEILPLLDQPIPESYIALQDIVRSLAVKCLSENQIPIFSKNAFISAVHDAGYTEKIDELEQACNFLHENGILLHYEDSSLLSDLYFVDPQWLCSMLAKVVTVEQRNPFQKQGFMLVENLKYIFPNFLQEFMTLMQKFEVILLLDDNRLLIPSLLPGDEREMCVVFARFISTNLGEEEAESIHQQMKEPHAPLCQTPHRLLVRHYLLPFVPNGFFTRVIARLMSSDIIEHLQNSFASGPLGGQSVLNTAHWKCWRNGIIITWNHMEIFRIAPLIYPLMGTADTNLISVSGIREVETTKGVEIKVAVLPDEVYVGTCSVFQGEDCNKDCPKGKCMASWLLHQATAIIDSVFEDWYEVFAKKKGFDMETCRTANPCNQCFSIVHEKECLASITPTQRRMSRHMFTETIDEFAVVSPDALPTKTLYLFSSQYCSLAVAKGIPLVCPNHGKCSVADVAPDVMFCDFPPTKVFPDPHSLVMRQVLGDGGFGAVYKATLELKDVLLPVAAKEIRPEQTFLEPDPDVIAELQAWDVYQKASLEARVMSQLCHDYILGLIGITLQPLRLLVELAPLGDLKACVNKFKNAKVQLSRRTISTTLIQVAEALDYLHTKNFVYRDLKPENILVWKYPIPETQWCDNSNAIYLKVADYGISKQVSPQGIRGIEGTRPYLPPEVILHGGREAYSKKLDVYAFGMFLYYLVTFLSPFEKDARPITALLEEKRRPEVPTKLRPHSVQMFELMCWCWSDLPQHRPTFQEILSILKNSSFRRLLASTSVTKNGAQVTTACLRTIPIRRNSMSSFHSRSAIPGVSLGGWNAIEMSMSHTGVMSLLYGGGAAASTQGQETAVQVWFGTENGNCGMVQFQRSSTSIEHFELPAKRKNKYISNVKVIGGHVWICTVGSGLFVFNADRRLPVASWGEDEKQQIYTLLYIEETSAVLVLTHKGMYAFSSDIGNPNGDILVPYVSIPKTGSRDINEGVVIPCVANMGHTEVWVCSQGGIGFQVLNLQKFALVEEVYNIALDQSSLTGRKIRHMYPIVMNDRSSLAVANRHMIECWDVELREKKTEFNCLEHCKEIYGDHHSATHNSRVTSLVGNEGVLYVGTGGGVLLTVNCDTMEMSYKVYAYAKPVRSLLVVVPGAPSRAFTRLFSRKDSVLSTSSSNGSFEETSPPSFRKSGSNASLSVSTPKLDRSVLISFGVGYRGVVGDSTNCPQYFMLPSEGKKNHSKVAKPSPNEAHLLLWSNELDRERHGSSSKSDDNNMPDFDELEEYQ